MMLQSSGKSQPCRHLPLRRKSMETLLVDLSLSTKIGLSDWQHEHVDDTMLSSRDAINLETYHQSVYAMRTRYSGVLTVVFPADVATL
jgi:hypothetical protein